MCRLLKRRVSALMALGLACLFGLGMSAPARAGAWSATDLYTHLPLPSGTVTVDNEPVSWQVGNYWSGGLRIYGLLCAPERLRGPRPVAILNHGLSWVDVPSPNGGTYPAFTAIEGPEWYGCTQMAASGWLTAISTYRGEFIGSSLGSGFPAPYQAFWGLSDGGLELCGGEVDDVLNLLAAVTALPNANPKRVLMWGHSHGSCITERAVERGAPVQIAVSLDGPTDFANWVNNNPLLAPTPAAQDARSSAWTGPNPPSNDPAALADVRFLRIQAEGDTVVPPTQGCELASKLPGGANYYLFSSISPPGVYWFPPPECAAYPMPWKLGQLLPDEGFGLTWSSPTFLMYSGLDHGSIRPKSWPEFRSFVNAIAVGDHWGASIPAQYVAFEK